MLGLIDKIALAIAKEEGWGVTGTLPKRLNNPGDLDYAGQIGAKPYVEPGRTLAYAEFSELALGIAALQRQIWKRVAEGATLRSLISIWAPPTENKTEVYLWNVKQWTGVTDVDRKLLDLIAEQWQTTWSMK